jgi:hypothetical protein
VPKSGPPCSLVGLDGSPCGRPVIGQSRWLICNHCAEDVARLVKARTQALLAEAAAKREAERAAHWSRRADSGQNVVYYVQVPGDLIKIGTTSNMRGRLSGLTARVPDVLACEPGGYDVERQRHQQFAHLRWRDTERFKDCPELREHIAAIRQEHGHPRIGAYGQSVTFVPAHYRGG